METIQEISLDIGPNGSAITLSVSAPMAFEINEQVDKMVSQLEVNYLTEFCQRNESAEIAEAVSPPPPPPPPPPTSWEWNTPFDQRQFNMLQFGFMTDFVVITQNSDAEGHALEGLRRINVHKAVIASASPQFYIDILRLGALNIEEIDLTEDDPRNVVLFLRYLYVGDPGLSSIREAVMMHKFAYKYKIQDLAWQLDNYLKNYEFNMDTALAWLPFALFTNNRYPTLEENVLDYCCRNGDKLFASKKFYCLQPKVLHTLLQRDDLNVRFETTVMHGIVNWGQAQCHRDKPHLNEKRPENFGPYIKEFLPLIRFPIDLNPMFWFSRQSKPDKVLQQIFFSNHAFVNYNKVVRRYSKPFNLLITRYNDENGTRTKFPLVKWNCRDSNLKFRETLMFCVNLSYVFYGFGLVSGMFGENLKKYKYDYTGLVAEVGIIISSDTFIPKLDLVTTPDNRLRVHFREPIDLPARKWVLLMLTLKGCLRRKPKASKDAFSIICLSDCPSYVGIGMRPESCAVFTPVDANMLLPMSCQFRRANCKDQLGIDKGFINTLWFSLNKPHPEDKQCPIPLNVTPHLLMELEVTEAICGGGAAKNLVSI